jgi:hypothetical protein
LKGSLAPVKRPVTQAHALRSVLAMALGLGLLAFLVQQVDARRVWQVLVGSGAWLPLLAALEALLLVTDSAAFAALLASNEPIPTRGWLRSSAGSYLCLVLLPAGRALGEAARAVLATPYAGARRAATASTELQAVALIADGIVSLACAWVVFSTVGSAQHLASALLGTCGLVTLSGALLLYLVRAPGAGQWLLGRFPRLTRYFPEGARGPTGSAWKAALWSVLGRALQVLQYGLAIRAVGGAFGLESAFIAQGIHMVGATVGVAMPNQIGVADGAYVIFANALGFAGDPARALGAMLAVRCAQLLLAAGCACLVVVLRPLRPTPSPVC